MSAALPTSYDRLLDAEKAAALDRGAGFSSIAPLLPYVHHDTKGPRQAGRGWERSSSGVRARAALLPFIAYEILRV